MRGIVAVVAVFALLVSLATFDLAGHRLFSVGGSRVEPSVPRASLVIVRATYPAALAFSFPGAA